VIEIQPGEKLDRDFILRWRVGGRELASSLVCVDDADGRAGTWMLTFVPPSTTSMAQKPRDVVFVLDRSGSMEGWKMVAARRACARMIDTLTSRDRFSVIAFDDRIEGIPGAALADATDRTRFRAVEAIAKIDARGGTELAQPLALATSLLTGYDDRERVIVLVTDGQVGNEDHILRELAPSLKNTRMFTLGIDQAVNAAFLRRLASAGGGLCELVESEDRLDAVMAKVHRRIGVPVATELDLAASGLDLAKATITPKKLPDVYAGAPVVVFGRYGGSAPSDASISISGTSFGDPLKLTIARDPITRGASGWLAASWARAHIRDLEDRYAAGDRSLEGQIVKVSKQFSVLSRFTAFLAIDRSEVVNAGGKLTQAVQPVESPAGWEMQNATRAGTLRRSPMMAQAAAPMMPGAAPAVGGMAPRGFAKTMAAGPSFDMDDEAPSEVGESAFDAAADALTAAPPPPPMSRSRAPFMPAPKPAKEVADKAKKREEAPAADAYLVQLGQLARELEAHAKGGNAGAIRLLRQRLTEWVEDLRSVGTHGDLADAVEQLVARLTAALGGTDLATEATDIAKELAQLAGGTPPTKKSRLEFWT
jgi:Ca-activated chloride channel family protein